MTDIILKIISGLKISDALISAIPRSCPDIRTLILDRSDGFSNIPIIEIARFSPKLQHLSLNSCICFTNRCITEIARSCPKLKHLELGNCSIVNKAVEEGVSLNTLVVTILSEALGHVEKPSKRRHHQKKTA